MSLLRHRAHWALPATLLALVGLTLLVPTNLSAQATDDGSIVLNCPDSVIGEEGELTKFTCTVEDTTKYRRTLASQGYNILGKVWAPWQTSSFVEVSPHMGNGVYQLDVWIVPRIPEDVKVTTWGASDFGRIEGLFAYDTVLLKVRQGELNRDGITLLWIQGIVLIVGLIWAVPAAIIGLFHAKRLKANRLGFAARSAGYSALLLLPWFYFLLRANKRKPAIALVYLGYVPLYGFWCSFLVHLAIITRLSIAQIPKYHEAATTWLFPPELVLIIGTSILALAGLLHLLGASVSMFIAHRHLSAKSNAPEEPPSYSLPHAHYKPFRDGLIASSLAWAFVYLSYPGI